MGLRDPGRGHVRHPWRWLAALARVRAAAILGLGLGLLPLASVAGPLQEEGEAHFREGRLPQALVAWSKALREARAGGDRAAEARAHLDLGRVHRALRRHADAQRAWEEAEQAAKATQDRGLLGRVQVQRGLHARELGRHREATDSFRAAFTSFQAVSEPVLAADALLDLGLVDREAGRPLAAVDNLEGAVRLYAAARHAEGEGAALLALGPALSGLGRFRDARTALGRSIELAAGRGTAGDNDRGAALVNLAHVEARLGDPERAQALLRQARPLLTRPEDRRVLEDDLGALLLHAGRTDEALGLWDQLLRDAPAADARHLLVQRALALRQAGRGKEAEAVLEDARQRAQAAQDRGTEARASLGLAEAALLRKDVPAAEKLATAATTLADELGDLELRITSRTTLARSMPGPRGLARLREAAALAEATRQDLEDADPSLARRWVEARGGLYRALVDASLLAGDSAGASLWALRLGASSLPQGGPAAGPEEAMAQELRARGSSLEQALQGAQDDPERSRALRTELDAARAEYSEFVDRLRASYPDWRRFVAIEPAEVEASARRIGTDEAILQVVLLPDRLVLLVTTREGMRHAEVQATYDLVSHRVNRALRTLRERRLDHPERFLAHLDQLGQWLIAPVADRIRGKRRLIVLTDGPLRYLNAGMLRLDGHFLVEQHEVLHANDLGALGGPQDGLRLTRGGLLALANPDGTLPAADEEARALAGLFPGARTLSGRAATRDALLQGPPPHVLHLATHGVLDAQVPERSHLVLAGPEGGVGALGYLEIPALAPVLQDTQLVVLSACESAVPLAPDGGPVGGSGIEIAGLAYQFRRAGVPRLVASLWQVSDDSTRTLMTGFYEALGQGRDPVSALALAQRRLLSAEAWRHPFFWAAFVVQ